MDITVYNKAGKAGEKVAISDKLLGAKANKDLVYQVATTQMANNRQILAHTKTRSEVRGGGKKPWKQKGTGRARHGSIRSPIWVGGGVSHGPTKEVNFKKKVNRVQARAAMLAVLSSRVTDGHMLVVDTLGLEKGKTKEAATLFATLASKGFKKYRAGERILLVLSGTTDDMPIRRSTANIQHIDTIRAQDLNALTVLSYPFVIATRDAVEVMEKTFITTK